MVHWYKLDYCPNLKWVKNLLRQFCQNFHDQSSILVEEGRSCIINESDDEDPGCAPNCCYHENEYPIKDFKLEECMNFCREREDCTRAEWKPKRRGRRGKPKCYIYSSDASETCCNAESIAMYCIPKGSKWITCSSPAN